MRNWVSVGLSAVLFVACFEITVPPEDQLNPSLDRPVEPSEQPTPTDSPVTNADVRGGNGVWAVDAQTEIRARFQDVPSIPCTTHCDCEPGNDCVNEICVESAPVQCCFHPLCRAKDPCWRADGQEGKCEAR